MITRRKRRRRRLASPVEDGPEDGRSALPERGVKQTSAAGATRKRSPRQNAAEAVILLDPELERIIVRTVEKWQLYHLGRFETAVDQVSLAWIPIGPLLNVGANLAGVVMAMARWLENGPLKGHPRHRVLLLGMDAWGAILASQISVMTDIPAYVAATRGGGRYHTSVERMAEDVAAVVTEPEVIIMVTDVVGTGHSIEYVCNELSRLLPKRPRYLALSVLCSQQQLPRPSLSAVALHATACRSISMPIIGRDALPSERILPPVLSIT